MAGLCLGFYTDILSSTDVYDPLDRVHISVLLSAYDVNISIS